MRWEKQDGLQKVREVEVPISAALFSSSVALGTFLSLSTFISSSENGKNAHLKGFP